jgi:hypothetical protein
MNDRYLLEELLKKVLLTRKAQRAYYGYRARLDDPMKRSYLQESQRREVDLDRAISEIAKVDLKLKSIILAIQQG